MKETKHQIPLGIMKYLKEKWLRKGGHNPRRRKATINEEFQPKNPTIQELILTWKCFLNIDYVIDKRRALNTWKAAMTLSLISEPIYASDNRDVNTIYNLLINSFQWIVYNWYTGISLNIKNIIKIDVKKNWELV